MVTPFSRSAQVASAVLVKPSTGAVTNYRGGDDADNGAALVEALDDAESGDRILLSVGHFDLGAGTISVPPGVTLSGAGKHLTTIRSSFNGTSSGPAIVGLSDGCTVERLSIDSTNPNFSPAGTLDFPIGHAGYTGTGDLLATLCELHVSGKSDGLYFINNGSAKIRIVAYDCDFSTQYDALVFTGGVQSSLLLYNVNAIADGPGALAVGVNAFRGESSAGSVFWYGGSAVAITTSTPDASALKLVPSTPVHLWGVKLASATTSTGAAYDVNAHVAGIIAEFYGVSYDPTKVRFPGNITIFGDPVLVPTTYTIASDAIDVILPDKLNYERVDTQSDAPSDDLKTIDGGKHGQMLVLRQATTSHKVTLRDDMGNLQLAGDYKLGSSENAISLMSAFDAENVSTWYELFRSPVLAPSTYTIATGAIEVDLPNQWNYHLVDTGGGAANLTTINGAEQGKILILKAANNSNPVTLIDGTNLKLAGDFALDNVEDSIGLIAYSSTRWHELFRSNNGA